MHGQDWVVFSTLVGCLERAQQFSGEGRHIRTVADQRHYARWQVSFVRFIS